MPLIQPILLLRTSSKALPFCHVTLKGQKPLPPGYPKQPKTLGDQLRKRRMDLGLSQRQFARQLGVNRTSIEHWERNEVEPTRWMVPKIREFLGQPPSPPPTLFGERLTAYRRGLGLSQEALARMLGVHKTTVVRWETGRRHPLRSLQGRIDALISKPPGASTLRNPDEEEWPR
jgi:transcriptional regulator with XRE-family HTH domain